MRIQAVNRLRGQREGRHPDGGDPGTRTGVSETLALREGVGEGRGETRAGGARQPGRLLPHEILGHPQANVFEGGQFAGELLLEGDQVNAGPVVADDRRRNGLLGSQAEGKFTEGRPHFEVHRQFLLPERFRSAGRNLQFVGQREEVLRP